MMVQIWHQQRTSPWIFAHIDDETVLKAEAESLLEYKGDVEVKTNSLLVEDCLEEAWRKTQNFDYPWSDPPCRSTSVGDVLSIGDDRWFVAACGFTKIPRHVQTELKLEVAL